MELCYASENRFCAFLRTWLVSSTFDFLAGYVLLVHSGSRRYTKLTISCSGTEPFPSLGLGRQPGFKHFGSGRSGTREDWGGLLAPRSNRPERNRAVFLIGVVLSCDVYPRIPKDLGAKDRLGYEYDYDYENRIVKVTKDNNDIAEFAYDALGRRIRKSDIERVIKPYFYCGRLQKAAPAFSVSNVLDDPPEGSPPGICRLRPWRRLFRSTS